MGLQGWHFTAPAPLRGEPSGHSPWWEGWVRPLEGPCPWPLCQEGLCSGLGPESSESRHHSGAGPQPPDLSTAPFDPLPQPPKSSWSPGLGGLLWFGTRACRFPVPRNSKAANLTPGTCALLGYSLGQRPDQRGLGAGGLGGREGDRGNSGGSSVGNISTCYPTTCRVSGRLRSSRRPEAHQANPSPRLPESSSEAELVPLQGQMAAWRGKTVTYGRGGPGSGLRAPGSICIGPRGPVAARRPLSVRGRRETQEGPCWCPLPMRCADSGRAVPSRAVLVSSHLLEGL